jgi:NADPH:quinone reductase-like Zn-dependent oxidoreductase
LPCPTSWRARELIHKRRRYLLHRAGSGWRGESLGDGASGIEPGQIVATMPSHGAYAGFVCLPQRELVPVPLRLDAAEPVSLVLNYITAYQMLYRSAEVKPSQRALIHGAAGGVGTALLQLGRLAGLEIYGTRSSSGVATVTGMGVAQLITSIRIV